MRLERKVQKYFTYRQVADILNVPVCEVRELDAEGELVPTRLATRWRFSEQDLIEFINKHRRE